MKTNSNTKIISNHVILVPYEEKHVPKYHSWMEDEQLLTLTASDPLTLDQEFAMQKTWREDEDKCTFIILERLAFEVTRNEIESMIGDVNLFIDMEHGNKAEIEIMIAEELARGRGYGIESTAVMMLYGIEQLDIPTFQAKIGKSNEKSIKMFQQLGFEVIGTNEKFKEVIYEKHVEEDWIDYIKELCGFEMCDYNVEEK